MAEHLIVVQAVEGSSPFVHPVSVDGNTCGRQVFCFSALASPLALPLGV